ALLTMVAFGAIGFWDDYLKKIRKSSTGLRAKYKFLLEIAIATAVVGLLYIGAEPGSNATRLNLPFFKQLQPDLGAWYILFGAWVIVGTSNAVNLTDGLDGLATGPFIIATFVYAGIAYVVGNANFADYLNIIHVRGAGELAVFCGGLLGASLGFLWFNAYPAQVFMGDVGSLALGGALGTVAVLAKHELLLLVIGGLFVIETLSVIIQVASFKLTGKRVFRMAPLHHHFEAKGWQEPKVIVRFWIIAITLALFSLSTLKLRFEHGTANSFCPPGAHALSDDGGTCDALQHQCRPGTDAPPRLTVFSQAPIAMGWVRSARPVGHAFHPL